MKTIFRFTLLALIETAFCACDDDKSYVAPLDVTPNNLAGTWQLAQWNGAPLAQAATHTSSSSARPEVRRVPELRQLRRPQAHGTLRHRNRRGTGRHHLRHHDYSAGDWQHRYIVTDFSKTQMIWTAKDDRSDISVYERCDGIPEDITEGKRSNKSSRRSSKRDSHATGKSLYLCPERHRPAIRVGNAGNLQYFCAKTKTDYDTTTAFIPFKSRADKGWAEAGALRKSFPTTNAGARRPTTGLSATRISKPTASGAAGSSSASSSTGVPTGTAMSSTVVRPALRGKNMGSAAPRPSAGRSGASSSKFDLPEDDISIRRRHFYERLGFVANPYQYIHPSFRKPFTPHRLVLMSYPGAITYEEARSFADFVREAVLRYSEHEAPALPKLP